jgi:hypothetical protein
MCLCLFAFSLNCSMPFNVLSSFHTSAGEGDTNMATFTTSDNCFGGEMSIEQLREERPQGVSLSAVPTPTDSLTWRYWRIKQKSMQREHPLHGDGRVVISPGSVTKSKLNISTGYPKILAVCTSCIHVHTPEIFMWRTSVKRTCRLPLGSL